MDIKNFGSFVKGKLCVSRSLIRQRYFHLVFSLVGTNYSPNLLYIAWIDPADLLSNDWSITLLSHLFGLQCFRVAETDISMYWSD